MGEDDPRVEEGSREVCLCFHVTLGMLVRHARGRRVRLASQFAECHGAGTGCGWCRPHLSLIAEQLAASPGSMPRLPMGPDDYAGERARANAARGIVGRGERLADELEG